VVTAFTEILADEELGTKEEVEAELNAMMRAIRLFFELEPDAVMRIGAAYSARLTEIYVHLHRVEGRVREWRQVRTQQVIPILTELDRQFKRASRELEIRRQDLDQLRGMR
jgi:hypothetical protein